MDPMNVYGQITETDEVTALPVSRDTLNKVNERQATKTEVSKMDDEREHHHNHRHRHHQQLRRRRRR